MRMASKCIIPRIAKPLAGHAFRAVLPCVLRGHRRLPLLKGARFLRLAERVLQRICWGTASPRGLDSSDCLETSLQAQSIASRWRNGISGEQAGEIDQVEAIVDVLNVSLQSQGNIILLPDICAD